VTELLSDDEREQFAARGFAGPFDVLPEDVALQVGRRLVTETIAKRSPIYDHTTPDLPHLYTLRDRHLDSPLLARVLGDRRIVGRVAQLVGPNVLLWRSDFFLQGHGDTETKPHQDKNFSGMRDIPALEAPDGGIALNVTAWIAFTQIDRRHGGLFVVPGSHRDGVLPEVPADRATSIFGKGRVLAMTFSDAERHEIVVRPGQFILFSNLTVHGSYAISDPSTSERRIAMSARYTPTETRVNPRGTETSGHNLELSRYGAMLVAGTSAGFTGPLRTAPPGDATARVEDEAALG
jgi:non-haem Fe2+, alpha-ketoglutarate-dependent halogenase